MSTLRIPCYPARPLNGGPLDKALPKSGHWIYEPKVNGWRSLVHTPTGTMFNRKGQRLSIEKEFTTVLDRLKGCPFEWLDCEAFERRHPLGRGSLIVLDYLPVQYGKAGTWTNRLWNLHNHLVACGGEPWMHEQFGPPENSLLWFAYDYADAATQEFQIKERHAGLERQPPCVIDPDLFPEAAWLRLQEANKVYGCELFEGLVAKRIDSTYPIQLRSPDAEFPFWMKHRWAF